MCNELPANSEVLSNLIGLIMNDCRRLGWSIGSSRPTEHNPDRQYVAHIKLEETGEVIGLGMSGDSNAKAIVAAYRSAWDSQFEFNAEHEVWIRRGPDSR